MTSTVLAFVVACLVSGVLTPLIARLASRARLVEGADGAHVRAVPRVGGVAIVLGFLVPLAGVFLLQGGATAAFAAEPRRLAAFLFGALAIFGLGLWDDIFGLTALPKLLVEVLVAAGCWLAGFRVESVRLPTGDSLDLGIFGLVLTVLWIVGLTNALNLVDGMDGLAAGVALFAAASHVLIGAIQFNVPLMLFSASLAGAVLGFLPQNFPPARLFMGDSGALFLGFCLAVTSIYSATTKATTALTMLGPVLILGLPILDTGLAVFRRARRGQPVFDGDREHLHHRLLSLGLSERRSILLLYGLCAAFALAGLVATVVSSWTTGVAVAALLVMLAIFERRLRMLRIAGRAESHPAVEAARMLVLGLSSASSPDEAFDAACRHAETLGVQRVAVETPDAVLREWRAPAPRVVREGVLRIELPLRCASGGRSDQRLVLEKRPIRRGAVLADDLLALALEAGLARGDVAPDAAQRALTGSPGAAPAGVPGPARPGA